MITVTLTPSWTVIDARYYPHSTSWEVMALDGDWWYKGIAANLADAFAQLNRNYERRLPLGKKRPITYSREPQTAASILELSLDDFNL